MHMRLSWKDLVSLVLVLVGLALALSVMQGWNWPLLGGVREGIVALAIFGFGAHLMGAPRERFYWTDPFGLVMVLAVAAGMVVAIVGGLITGSEPYLLVLMIVTPVLWVIATLRHAIEGRAPTSHATPA
jgi:hypothetical protein